MVNIQKIAVQKIAVIGAGVMGSGIAAQIANTKTKVILLDVPGTDDRNARTHAALEKLLRQQPPPLSHPDYINYMTTGNTEDDLELIRDCDIVIEAIIEQLEAKHKLYNLISNIVKPEAIIVSNTSTLSLRKLKAPLRADLQSRFFITHFFNPPRYMELVELITDSAGDPEAIANISKFITESMGKTIVRANDTPGFIANRVGCFLLEMTVRFAIKDRLNPVIIDQIFTKLLGFPGTGIFGLYDLIGHDVMQLISKSLLAALPPDDEYKVIYQDCELLNKMQNLGLIGQKAKGGFYRFTLLQGKRHKEVIDFTNFTNLTYQTIKYQPVQEEKIPATIAELIKLNNEYTVFFLDILSRFFVYITKLIPEVTASSDDLDLAMQLGYNLKLPPFAMLSILSQEAEIVKYFKIREHGNIINFTTLKLPAHQLRDDSNKKAINKEIINREAIVTENSSAYLALVRGQYVFRINSKANSLNPEIFNLLIEAVKRCEDDKKPLYIFPLLPYFSSGADLNFFRKNILENNLQAVKEFIALGQKAMLTLKHAGIFIISCACGVALGGGCELLLHSDLVIAHQNLNAGLVESGIGLLPGWGGVKEMFLRSKGEAKLLADNLKNILTANRSSSADYFGRNYLVNYQVNMNKNLILNQAFNSYNDLSSSRKVQPVTQLDLPDMELSSYLDVSNYSSIQLDIMQFFQDIINQKRVTEETLLAYEQEKFLELVTKLHF